MNNEQRIFLHSLITDHRVIYGSLITDTRKPLRECACLVLDSTISLLQARVGVGRERGPWRDGVEFPRYWVTCHHAFGRYTGNSRGMRVSCLNHIYPSSELLDTPL